MTEYKDKYSRYEGERAELSHLIPREDLYSYAVLARILGGECRLTITDGARLIICHSSERHPVWIWMPDDASEEELEECYSLLLECFEPGVHRFNAKYNIAEYLIDRARMDGHELKITLNMLAYGCENPIEPRPVDAVTEVASEDDIELAVNYLTAFHKSTRLDLADPTVYREKAEELIRAGRLFFLRDTEGEAVSMCSYSGVGGLSTVGNVYTPESKRRRGYAARLVYDVTRIILESGELASIYTDADYSASNACYLGIGYRVMGRLCTFS